MAIKILAIFYFLSLDILAYLILQSKYKPVWRYLILFLVIFFAGVLCHIQLFSKEYFLAPLNFWILVTIFGQILICHLAGVIFLRTTKYSTLLSPEMKEFNQRITLLILFKLIYIISFVCQVIYIFAINKIETTKLAKFLKLR